MESLESKNNQIIADLIETEEFEECIRFINLPKLQGLKDLENLE